MDQKNPVQPILILPEGYTRQVGRDAQRSNILAGKIVAETIRTTLGPKGMDKMLVDSLGDVVVTNDGVTILKEMEVENPAAKMMVEIAKTQEEEVGDGTTTAVVIAGELLKEAEKLLDQNVHPTIIANGYKIAALKAIEKLEEISEKIDTKDKKLLKKIAETAMTGKGAYVSYAEKLASLVVDVILKVEENGHVDRDAIKIEKKMGNGVEDSELIEGVTIDKERVHPDMPSKVENAKILLLESPLEVKETERDAQIRVETPDQLQAFIEQEEKMIKEMIEKISSVGANVVFCQKGIDDLAQYYLSKKGIIAIRRVTKSDMEKLAKATGAKIITNIKEITEKDLGFAGIVEEKKVAGDSMIFVEKCKNPKALTILLRGGTEHVVDEIERALTDAIGDISAVIENGKIVGGGGAAEIEAAEELRKYAKSLSGREQLAVNAFANALEIIPKTLAENGGLDPIDMLVALKSEHAKGNKTYGINVDDGKVEDMVKKGIIEPLKIKTQALKSASEVATMILRIDDVIAAGKLSKESSSPQMPEM